MPTTLTRRVRARAAGGPTDVLLAACLWGTTGTVRTTVEAASDTSIAGVRIVVGGAVLLALALVDRRPPAAAAVATAAAEHAARRRGGGLRRLLRDRANRLAVAAGAVAVAAYQTAFFHAASRTGVAVGTVVTIGSAPAFAGLVGLAARRSAVTRRWLAATAGAVAGCALLVGAGDGGTDPVGVGLALLSGCAYAVYATVVSVLVGRGEDDRAVVGALFGGAAALMLPTLAGGAAAWALGGRGLVVALYLGAVTTGGGYLLFARGLRTTPATTATTLTLLEPAVAAALGVAVLGESLGGPALAGVALVAASLALLLRAPRSSPGGTGGERRMVGGRTVRGAGEARRGGG